MGALKLVFAAAALLLAVPAGAQGVERWREHIAHASVRFGMPEDWIARVIMAESGGRTSLAGRPITSRAGAMGLMQLMPATWAEMRDRHGLGADPHDPRDNILAGTAYLRAMYDRFGYPGLFAAYNAGPARYTRHLATGRPLPAETRAYLAAVARRAEHDPPRRAGLTGQSIFAIRPGTARPRDREAGAVAAPGPAGSPLFVPLRQVRSGQGDEREGRAGLGGDEQ